MFAAWQRHHSGHRGSNSFSSYCKCLMATLKPQSNGPLYSNTVIGMLVIDGWAVTFGTARRGLGGAAAHQRPVYRSPYCCIMVCCSAVLMCPLKG